MAHLRSLLLLTFTLTAGSAAAQGRDPAGAEVLFQEGRRLMDAKDYAGACAKFEASQRAAAAVGTLLNLAECQEKRGLVASAWLTFRSAVSEAQRVNRPDREKLARERAALLEKRVPKLIIVAGGIVGLQVKRDDVLVEAALYGAPVPIDPGKHVVSATAPGKKPWSTEVAIDNEGSVVTVSMPELEDAPRPAASSPAPVDASPTHLEGDLTNAPASKGGSAQKTIGFAALGVGVVGLAGGAVFGLQASAKWSDAKDRCRGTVCDATGVGLRDDATSAATLSTIFFAAGGVVLAAGAVLVLTAPKQSATGVRLAPYVARDGAGVGVGGTL